MTEDSNRGEQLDVLRMALDPGDVIVVTCEQSLSLETSERISKLVKAKFPEHGCIVLSDGLKISTLGRDERLARLEDKVDDIHQMLTTIVDTIAQEKDEAEEDTTTLDGAPGGKPRDQTQSLG